MPAQHNCKPHHLALAIALTLGCTDVTYALDEAPPDLSTAQLRIESVAPPDEIAPPLPTTPSPARKTKARKTASAAQQTAAQEPSIDASNDFPVAPAEGKGSGPVLQLNSSSGGQIGESHDKTRREFEEGNWTIIKGNELDRGANVHAEALLVNFGTIKGSAAVSGILRNGGTIEGDLVVLQDGLYFGNGAVNGDLNVQGQLRVNRVMGAPHVKGNMSLTRDAVLAYEVLPDGRGETIKVDGTANLGQATLKILASGQFPQASQYTIIEAAKVEEKFATIENNLAFMNPELDYTDSTKVTLTYSRNAVPLAEAATDRNARNVANSIDESKANSMANAAVSTLLGSTRQSAAYALELLAGDSNANLAKATLNSDAPISATERGVSIGER